MEQFRSIGHVEQTKKRRIGRASRHRDRRRCHISRQSGMASRWILWSNGLLRPQRLPHHTLGCQTPLEQRGILVHEIHRGARGAAASFDAPCCSFNARAVARLRAGASCQGKSRRSPFSFVLRQHPLHRKQGKLFCSGGTPLPAHPLLVPRPADAIHGDLAVIYSCDMEGWRISEISLHCHCCYGSGVSCRYGGPL